MTGRPVNLDAFEVLITEHEQMLYSYLLGLVKNTAVAEDLAQETFVKAFRNLHSLKDPYAFKPWIRTIARNLAIDEFKRRKKEIATDPDFFRGMEDIFAGLESMPGETWEEKTLAAGKCFELLPEKLREACRQFYLEEKRTDRIAENLSISPVSVRKNLERGRNLLRECVEKALRLTEVPA